MFKELKTQPGLEENQQLRNYMHTTC